MAGSAAGKKILIVRLGAMGDILHAMPAVAALRRRWPGCEFGWVIERRWAELLSAPGEPLAGPVSETRPLVERVHLADTRGWRKSLGKSTTWQEIFAFRRELRAAHYDLAIDFQGAIKSAAIARLSGALELCGFAAPRERAAARLYQHRFPATAAHVVEQNLELASAIAGGAVQGDFLLPRSRQAEEWTDKFLQDVEGKRFAILNPGAGWGAKCWPVERFAEVARWLGGQGVLPLINSGPGEESLAEALIGAAGCGIRLDCTLSQLVELTRRSVLFVGGDTGPMHLAAALGTPLAALFGPTDPARNGPYSHKDSRAVVLRSRQSRTSYSHAATRDAGLAGIAAQDVIRAIEVILE
jgi:heptosyltransferase-1